MKNVPELLAPAGALPQLLAAVRSGADAVYFGCAELNARRNAANFTDDDFLSAVKYCHIAGVKCYITLNTLINDREIPKLHKTLELIAFSGADAVIVQDMASANAVFSRCPSLPVHASTQMAVHNAAGAKLLKNNGFSRIVAARELSIKEIRYIAENVDIDIEAFVHGAHCMSASGMCYMSSAFGARSGNRGLCAQPCRLNFRSDNREYALSLKDMCLIEHIDELKNAGVTSFKIEGRMKRPEYVAAAVTEYKKAIAGEKYDIKILKDIFSRNGFTDGYAIGKRNLNMFGHRTKEDVTAASPVMKKLEQIYKDEIKSVPVSIKLSIKENEKAALTVSDGKNTVLVKGGEPEKAVNVELTDEKAEKSLIKLGGTVFYPKEISCDIERGLNLSAAELNNMRRNAIAGLSEKRSSKTHKILPLKAENHFPVSKPEKPKLRLQFRKIAQIPNGISFDKIILPLSEIENTPDILDKYNDSLSAALPALIYPEDEKKIKASLTALRKKGLKFTLCENIGAIQLSKECGLTPCGGAILNILNSAAAETYYENGVHDITLSTEMSFDEMAKFHTHSKTGFIAYGHMPLMHFRCCPVKGEKGCGSCSGVRTISDRRGDLFTVLCSERKFSVLYNPIPLYTGDIKMPVVDFTTLLFTNETQTECKKIIELFSTKAGLSGKKTTGLYNKTLL